MSRGNVRSGGWVQCPVRVSCVGVVNRNRRRSTLRTIAYYGHTMRNKEVAGERDNARNNASCTPARKTTHGLDGQHQDMDRTPRGRDSQNDRGQR